MKFIKQLPSKTFDNLAIFISIMFAIVNLSRFIESGILFNLLKSFIAVTLAIVFYYRTPSRHQGNNIIDIMVTITHSILPILLIKTSSSLESFSVSYIIMMLGALISIHGLFSIWENFGVLPSLRGITSNGSYKLVRHPIYLGYLISIFGWISLNQHIYNLILFCAYIVLTTFRISREEKVLLKTSEYYDYISVVRFRLIPWLF